MPAINPNFNSLPMPGLSEAEAKDYKSAFKTNQTASSRSLGQNQTITEIFSDSPVAKMALAKAAPQLTEQLKSRTPSKEAIGMLSIMLAQTQADLSNSLFTGEEPDWQAQLDPSQRAQNTLNDYQAQYGWLFR
ncbi:MAG: hypothetical protein H7338_17490 [Candidatus Sericytochromatia bacterium]|nr:hypothetical protein [Candidatus Sericytochromatia bacterium]